MKCETNWLEWATEEVTTYHPTIAIQPLKNVIGGAVFPGGLHDADEIEACQHILNRRQIELQRSEELEMKAGLVNITVNSIVYTWQTREIVCKCKTIVGK